MPVDCSLNSREDQGPFFTGQDVGQDIRSTLRIKAVGPGLLAKLLRQQQLSGFPIKHVIETVAVGPQKQLARAPLKGGIQQHRNLGRIPVQHVVRSKLKVPL